MPTFTDIKPETQLFNLVGPSTFMFFDILGLDYQWLRRTPEIWNEYESYREAQEFVRTVKVVNDTAERGIKLVANYTQILT